MKRSHYTLLKRWHKWICLVITLFGLGFGLSGIVLNHRQLFSHVDIPRSCLPSSYHYHDWSSGSLKGAIDVSEGEQWLYGAAGVWAYYPERGAYEDRSEGLDRSADRRAVLRITRTTGGELFLLTAYDLYRWQDRWVRMPPVAGEGERLADLEVRGDSLLLLSRSHLYLLEPPYEQATLVDLPQPADYKREVSLFSTIWQIHSGAFFGIVGKLFVDLMGLALILLCVTGLLITFVPKRVRQWRSFVKEHNRWGWWFFWGILFVTITGGFLRPPLMIAVIRSQVPTIPGTNLYSTNPWYNKLRVLRYDAREGDWLLSTSGGFYRIAEPGDRPTRLEDTPPVSVMGLNVLERDRDRSGWIVGSFSGAFRWDRTHGTVTDALTGEPYTPHHGGMPVFGVPLTGYTIDEEGGEHFFDYGSGEIACEGGPVALPPMPAAVSPGRMSLWHAALELHVGRLYGALLGPVGPFYIFLSMLLISSGLITGWVLYRRYYRRKRRKQRSHS